CAGHYGARLDDPLALPSALDIGLAAPILRVVCVFDDQCSVSRDISTPAVPSAAESLQKRGGAGVVLIRGVCCEEIPEEDTSRRPGRIALRRSGDRGRAGGESSQVRQGCFSAAARPEQDGRVPGVQVGGAEFGGYPPDDAGIGRAVGERFCRCHAVLRQLLEYSL